MSLNMYQSKVRVGYFDLLLDWRHRLKALKNEIS